MGQSVGNHFILENLRVITVEGDAVVYSVPGHQAPFKLTVLDINPVVLSGNSMYLAVGEDTVEVSPLAAAGMLTVYYQYQIQPQWVREEDMSEYNLAGWYSVYLQWAGFVGEQNVEGFKDIYPDMPEMYKGALDLLVYTVGYETMVRMNGMHRVDDVLQARQNLLDQETLGAMQGLKNIIREMGL